MGPQRILITGAGGFVGKALVSQLHRDFPSVEITGLYRDSASAVPVPIPLLKAQIVDLVSGDIAGVLKTAKPDVVIHLAAMSSVQQSLGAGGVTFSENLTAGLRLIEAMEKVAPEAVLVFASSGEVYGRSFLTSPLVKESTPIFPNNAYARSKAALEFAIEDMFAPKGRAIVLRLFNHFGHGQDERFVLGTFAAQLRKIAAGAAPTIRVGNLEAARDFLPVADVLRAYSAAVRRALTAKTGAFEVFNIASGKPRRIASVLDDLIRLSKLAVTVEQDPARMRPSEIEAAAGDASKFSEATKWQPTASWDEALMELLKP
jgi:GDP-4-dehydro-6-deoxy-D-mannose reductase